MRHFDVQLIGGAVLHKGKIAEMKTGEGKTLVATLPAYLNALEGKGVHVVTVNDYLARRDSEWMGRIYRFLGMTVGVIQHDLVDAERQAAYACDITYGTNNEFGFDYLRDNMKFELAHYVQRGHHFAIVDEVDSILIDEARTPLIISGPAEQSTDLYYDVDRIIPKLKPGAVVRGDTKAEEREELEATGDYIVDEKHKTVTLTESGMVHAEQMLTRHLNGGHIYDFENAHLKHHVDQALRAHTLFKYDVDYMVKDGEVVIVDEFTGRLMPGRRWSDGLHQAVEAKEHNGRHPEVKIERENQTLATVTFQNYFRKYKKLSGMTGTADTEAEEFAKIYNLDVVVIPPNRQLTRIENPDLVYRTQDEKWDAIVTEIIDEHKKGRPVLVGTVSIEKSERIPDLRLLRLQLRLVGEVLQAAAAARAEVVARRLHARRARLEQLHRVRLRVVALHLRDACANGVPRQPAADEDDEAVQPRDAVAAECQRVDREDELLALGDRGGHRSIVAPRSLPPALDDGRPSGQDLVCPLDERRRREGLLDERSRRIDVLVEARHARVARHVEDGDVGAFELEQLDELGAAHVRHDRVGDEQVDLTVEPRADGKRFGAVRGLDDPEARPLQHLANDPPYGRLVLDEEDGRVALGRNGRRRLDDASGRRALRRQVDVEARAGAGTAAHEDEAAALLDDAVHAGQPEARAFADSLGREEGLERSGAGLLVHPVPGVADREQRVAARRHRHLPRREGGDLDVLGADREDPALGHRVPRVDGKVEQRLLQQPRVGADGQQAGLQVGHELDSRADHRPDHALEVLDHLVQVDDLRPRDLLATEREQLPREAGGSVGSAADLLDVLALVSLETGEEQLAVAPDRGEQVVELVGDPARETPHGLELLRLSQMLLEPPALGHRLGELRELPIEPGCLEGDGGVGGKGLEQLQLVVAEGAELPQPVGDDERAEHLALATQKGHHRVPDRDAGHLDGRAPRVDGKRTARSSASARSASGSLSPSRLRMASRAAPGPRTVRKALSPVPLGASVATAISARKALRACERRAVSADSNSAEPWSMRPVS